ncbi:MAG: ATP-binding protein [Desulfobacterales bacterium]|nr:ATP-binding protein [Desulfobacterales bacterium]
MKRTIYSRLVEWKHASRRKPLLLKGARQVGKTYILKQFGEAEFQRRHYINFEEDESLVGIFEGNLDPRRIVQELSFHLNSSINLEQDLLIFDEIQACPRAITSLKYFQEDLPGFPVCAAGSLLGLQLGQSSFPVGKVDYLHLNPMSFEEFLTASGEERYVALIRGLCLDDPIPGTAHERLWTQLKIFFITGGLPEIVNLYVDLKDNLFDALQSVRRRQADLIRDYLADIAKHSGKLNAMHIERVWKNTPAQLARELDGSAPKFRFKGVVPGVHTYARLVGQIDWLETAGLIIKVQIVNSGQIPFSAYAKENRFKLFFFDVGLLGAVSGLPPKSIWDYDYGSYKGYFAENFVAQEFRFAGCRSLYSWKENTAEVEFLREENGEVLPVEVKSGRVTQAKSLKVYAEKYNPEYRTVLSARNMRIDHENRVHHYPLYLASRFPIGRGVDCS